MDELWNHQRDALDFVSKATASMLAMDMGTGKSRCVVEAIAQDFASKVSMKRKCLIVCPKSVLPVWLAEFRRFYPGTVSDTIGDMPDALVLTPTKGTAQNKVVTICDAWTTLAEDFCHTDFVEVVVVNYETLIQKAFAEFAQKTSWRWCVLDESHRVKAHAGKTSKVVASINAERKLCLTGTPMPHSLLDIFAQARFLGHHLFGNNWIRFQRRYAILGVKVPKHYSQAWQDKLNGMPEQQRAHCMALLTTMKFRSRFREGLKKQLQRWLHEVPLTPGTMLGLLGDGPFTTQQWNALGKVDPKHLLQIVDYKNMPEFENRLAAFVFQVKADDVLDLPDAQDIVRPVTLESKSARIYAAMDKEFVADLADGRVSSAANALVRLLRLQQVTGGFVAVDDEEEMECIGTEKRDVLREMLEDMPVDEPSVVFCRFTKDIESVCKVTLETGRRVFELSGRTNELEDWQQDTDGSVLAVQIQAGGVGISLVRARYCIYYSVGFSLGDYLQSRARVRRPGQDRSVVYYHLVAQQTIDEKVYHALAARKEIVDEVMTNVANATA